MEGSTTPQKSQPCRRYSPWQQSPQSCPQSPTCRKTKCAKEEMTLTMNAKPKGVHWGPMHTCWTPIDGNPCFDTSDCFMVRSHFDDEVTPARFIRECHVADESLHTVDLHCFDVASFQAQLAALALSIKMVEIMPSFKCVNEEDPHTDSNPGDLPLRSAQDRIVWEDPDQPSCSTHGDPVESSQLSFHELDHNDHMDQMYSHAIDSVIDDCQQTESTISLNRHHYHKGVGNDTLLDTFVQECHHSGLFDNPATNLLDELSPVSLRLTGPNGGGDFSPQGGTCQMTAVTHLGARAVATMPPCFQPSSSHQDTFQPIMMTMMENNDPSFHSMT